ncbi:MAG TPA: hypothetical protein DCP92_06805 [Nitrospiraceae bacterium]|nr:hypothetical protein [Nitrospiraceae bacterium]
MLKKNSYLLFIALLTPVVFVALFTLRTLDDNSLTSWQWVFESVDASRMYFILIVGVIVAYLLSKVSLPVHCPDLVLFSVSFAVAVIFWGEPEVIVDASRYFTQAKHLEVYGITYFFREWGNGISAWTDLPLVPFLYGLIFRFIGECRFYVQIFTTFLFSMAVVLTFRIGKTLWSEDTGFFAGLALLGIPYLFTQIPLMLVDVPTMFFLTLSVFAFTKALFNGGLGMVTLSSFSLFLAFFSKYSTWPTLSILVIIFLICRTRNKELATRNCLFRAFLIIAAASIMVSVVFFSKFDVFSEQIKLLNSYQRPGLRRWGESFLSTFFFQIHPFITLSALYSAWVAFRKRDGKYLIICWGLILVILFQVKRIRYILPLFPMVALMASYGLQQIRDRQVRKFIILCILFSSLGVASFGYLSFTQKISAVNLKDAGKFVDSLEGETVEVYTLAKDRPIINPAVFVPILDIFTHKKIRYHDSARFSPGEEDLETSRFRFTWQYMSPGYYLKNNDCLQEHNPIVIIADGHDEILPDFVTQKIMGYQTKKEFEADEGVFLQKTFVTVYAPGNASKNPPKDRNKEGWRN